MLASTASGRRNVSGLPGWATIVIVAAAFGAGVVAGGLPVVATGSGSAADGPSAALTARFPERDALIIFREGERSTASNFPGVATRDALMEFRARERASWTGAIEAPMTYPDPPGE